MASTAAPSSGQAVQPHELLGGEMRCRRASDIDARARFIDDSPHSKKSGGLPDLFHCSNCSVYPSIELTTRLPSSAPLKNVRRITRSFPLVELFAVPVHPAHDSIAISSAVQCEIQSLHEVDIIDKGSKLLVPTPRSHATRVSYARGTCEAGVPARETRGEGGATRARSLGTAAGRARAHFLN